jgi:AcrR family transcriptional regulator
MGRQTRTPRERMVYGAAQLVRERGVSATGVRDVVDRAQAPRGSFQHYFPGGKDQLISEAVLWAGEYAAEWVQSYLTASQRPTPSGLFAHMVAHWKREYTTSGFGRGCPVMATAADVIGTESAIPEPLTVALRCWQSAIIAALAEMGVPARRRRRLATLMLSTLEGAIMMARILGSVQPLTTVVGELAPLLDAAASQGECDD